MKSTRRIIMALAAVGILALSGIAQANTTFTISGINISPSSDNSGLTWNTSIKPVSPITLTPGHSQTFDYATFNFTGYNYRDTDSLIASLIVTPPGTSQSDSALVTDATIIIATWADVDFTNAVKDVHFGNGGEYKLTFLDEDGIFKGCSGDLEATLSLISDSQPVPEPGTMMLLGAGFLGLAVWGKRRNKA